MPKKMIVRKSNDLIVAKYALSLPEMRIIQFMTSLIGRDDQDFQAYEITVADFCAFTGVRKDCFYSEFAKMCDSLLKKRVDIQAGTDVIYTCWMSSARYCHKEGKVQLKFAPELKPVLLNLKRCFTMYDFGNTWTLRSYYSIRMYELLKQYEKLGRRLFLLEDLKSILCVEDKYALYGQFKMFILQSAQKELKEKCDIYFDFEEQKTGRKVSGVLFKIYRNEKNCVIDGEYTEIKACPVKPLLAIEDKQDKPISPEPPLPAEDRLYEPLPPLPPAPRQAPDTDEYHQEILRQLSFIEENLPVQSLVSVYKAANGDVDLIRRRYYDIVYSFSDIQNITGALIWAIRDPASQLDKTPGISRIAPNEPGRTRFSNFPERNNDFNEFERLELEQFKEKVKSLS